MTTITPPSGFNALKHFTAPGFLYRMRENLQGNLLRMAREGFAEP